MGKVFIANVMYSDNLKSLHTLGIYNTKEEADEAIEKEDSSRKAHFGTKYAIHFSKVTESEIK